MKANEILIKNGLLTLLVSLIVSCANRQETIPVHIIPVARTVGEYNLLNLSEYATGIRYIPLETNDSALIGNISTMSYENEKIFIRDLVFISSNCYKYIYPTSILESLNH